MHSVCARSRVHSVCARGAQRYAVLAVRAVVIPGVRVVGAFTTHAGEILEAVRDVERGDALVRESISLTPAAPQRDDDIDLHGIDAPLYDDDDVGSDFALVLPPMHARFDLLGTVVGRRNTGWNLTNPEPGSEYTVTVTVTCSNQGARFDAETDEPVPASLTFARDFRTAVERIASRKRETRPRLAERPRSACSRTAPRSARRST